MLNESLALEVNINQYRQNNRDQDAEQESPSPALHAVGHVHAIIACHHSGNHQQDGYHGERLHDAVQVVADKLDPEANIIWGTQIDESLQNVVRTTVVVSGIKSDSSSSDSPDIEYAEEEPESESNNDQLDDFIDGIF